jgi:8-hydroxy-5-deazaflavin:NADPH oxidoreductase
MRGTDLARPRTALAVLCAASFLAVVDTTIVSIALPSSEAPWSSSPAGLVPAASSSAEELAAALPSSRVLKAFNTTFAGTLSAKSVGPNPTTVLVAGEDDDAKAALISTVQTGGVNAVDTGPLRRARELEAMGFPSDKLGAAEQVGWTGGFAVLR